MRVVVAPDKFKGSLTADQAAAALSAGLRRARPDLEISEIPVADGGDGTVVAALAAGFEPVPVTVEGPVGAPVRAVFALRDGTAVIELASASGLRCLAGPGPTAQTSLTASTYGTGQLIATALDRGTGTIVLGLGGSASTDGGAGMIQALGAKLAAGPPSRAGLAADGPPGLRGDRAGADFARGGAALADLASVDSSGLDPRLAGVRLLVASDVNNPLLGPDGAAAVFGPQKGAGPGQVAGLEGGLRRWAELTGAATGTDLAGAPGAGAAGGTGFAALAYLGATLVPGVNLVLDLVGFDAAVDGADLVVTGEGSLDRQTLGGKAPLGVARAAGRRGVPVIAVAGRVLLGRDELIAAGFSAAYALTDAEPDLAASMARAAELLEQAGARIAVGLGPG
ncbi:MAG: glycerate kinase [Streptosporangiaceae bacterium]